MSNSVELPLYQCHKQVRAAKITGIAPQNSETLTITLHLGDILGEVEVTSEWLAKHKPQIGSYFVVYSDSYTSCSPAEPFESGYTHAPATYQDPVRLEHADLVTKITKLKAYLRGSDRFTATSYLLLCDQLDAMRLYRESLAKRIAAFLTEPL